MSHAVPSQDSSPESFARLLNRLTRSSAQHASGAGSSNLASPVLDPLAEDHAVRVSISERGAALNASRKRTLTAVRQTPQSSRDRAEAGAIRYEDALRLHSRPRPADLPELPRFPAQPSQDSGKEKSHAAPVSGKLPRDQAEAKALDALRRARNRQLPELPEPELHKHETTYHGAQSAAVQPPETQARASRSRAAQSRSAEARQAQPRISAQRSRAAAAKPSRGAAGRHTPAAAAPSAGPPDPATASPLPSHPRKPHVAPRTAGGNPAQPPHGKRSASDARSGAKKLIRKQLPAAEPDMPDKAAASSSALPRSGALSLELAPLALIQRQSIVSIRLNAIESEQLRQRAAESGISVSAYMRSCVLEAEHLRSQVKQALAELRSTHLPGSVSAPRLEMPPASALSVAHNSAGIMRTGFFGFLSGLFTLALGRLHR